MFMNLKIRRAASRLVEEFPEITREIATGRARRLLSRHPGLSTDTLANFLISGEHTARMYETQIRRWS